MKLRLRPATAHDLRAYVRHLTVRDRYGELFGGLAGVWCDLLRQGLIIAAVVEDLDREQEARLVGLRVTAFLSDAFTRHARTPPLFWIGPELMRRIASNDSPILDYPGMRAANSGDGLNLFVWEVDARPLAEPEFLGVIAALARALLDYHGGFNIKEVIAQHPRGRILQAAIRSGDWIVHNRSGEFVLPRDIDSVERSGNPVLSGLTRELARKVPGNALGNLFCYTPALAFFTRAEQRLLDAARSGGTDEEMADALAISRSAVKKCWETIYRRAAFRLAELLPGEPLPLRGRGAEKRRRLLSYLRDHPEELRPYLPPPQRTGAAPARPVEGRRRTANVRIAGQLN